jgi:V8-like Glu-specific endopeptidase
LVSNPDDYPWRTTVYLFIDFHDVNGNPLSVACSGALIDSTHVLTAGHCVYQHDDFGVEIDDWADSIQVAPAYNAGYSDYEYADAIHFYSFVGWTEDANSDYDMAWILLDRPVGGLTGWLGYGYNEDDNFFYDNIFENPGYPLVPIMYTWGGSFDDVNKYSLDFNEYSWAGQSGSNAYHTGSLVSYGVLSNGSDYEPWWTSDTRIVANKFETIKDTITSDTPSYANIVPLLVEAGGLWGSIVEAGQELSFFTYLAFNQSSVSWDGSVSDTIYYSLIEDPDISTPIPLQYDGFSYNFAPKSGVWFTPALPPKIPGYFKPGTYWLGVVVEANSVSTRTLLQDQAEINVVEPWDLVLENETVESGETREYEAVSTIAAMSFAVQSGANVTFKAGSEIRLQDGFHAESGSDFHAKIE